MTKVVMKCCDCRGIIILVLDTEKKALRGQCVECELLFDLTKTNFGDDEIVKIMQTARRVDDAPITDLTEWR